MGTRRYGEGDDAPGEEDKPDFDPPPEPEDMPANVNAEEPEATPPASFNWVTQRPDCFQIDSQEECGSCWAWASAHALSQRTCIASEEITAAGNGLLLAPQDLVDCSLDPNNGCQGGFLEKAWADLKENGVRPQACVPYTAVDTAACPPTNSCTVATPAEAAHFYAFDAYSLKASNEAEIEAVINDIWRYGPMTVALEVFLDFMEYESGIYTKNNDRSAGGHAVIVTGWGEENGVKFWHGMNSWGTSWGENGYFRIRRGTDECSMESWSGFVAGRAEVEGIAYTVEFGNTSGAGALRAGALLVALLLACAATATALLL